MSEAEEVRARHLGFVAAFMDRDIDAMAGFVTDDHVGMPPGRSPLMGPEDSKQFWRDGFEAADTTFSTNADDLVVADDHAIDRFSWRMVISPKGDGPDLEDTGKCVWIWRREADGEWRLASAIWNSDRGEPTPWTGA